jgi:hypothetical protein
MDTMKTQNGAFEVEGTKAVGGQSKIEAVRKVRVVRYEPWIEAGGALAELSTNRFNS